MMFRESQGELTPKLIDALYVEAMLLADEARAYFDQFSREDRDTLPPMLRVVFSCESLKVTTRLMHVIAWLLSRRASDAGEHEATIHRGEPQRLGHAVDSEASVLEQLPAAARTLIRQSEDLYLRVKRLDAQLIDSIELESPARRLQRQLAGAF